MNVEKRAFRELQERKKLELCNNFINFTNSDIKTAKLFLEWNHWILSKAINNMYLKVPKKKLKSNKFKIEFLVFGYLRELGNELNLSNVCDLIKNMILSFALSVEGTNGFHLPNNRHYAFCVSHDNMAIRVKRPSFDRCLIYAQNNENGYNEGIHFWSVRCCYEQKLYRLQYNYASIGVVTEKVKFSSNLSLSLSCSQSANLKAPNFYLFTMDNVDNDETITIKLDCGLGIVTFFNGSFEIRHHTIDSKDKSYFFAMDMKPAQRLQFKAVTTPI